MQTVWLTLSRVVLSSYLVLGLIACETRSPQASPSPSEPIAPIPSVASASSVSTPSLTTNPLPPNLQSATITTTGFGPIQIGMTVAEAATAAGVELVPVGSNTSDEATCRYVALADGSQGLDFMVSDDRIVRVDVRQRGFQEVDGRPVEVDLTPIVSQITTRSGAAVGDTEAEVLALYPNQLEVSSHKYVPEGHYLTLVPQDPEESNYRIIFETDGDRVTMIRAGQLPQVEWVERCG